MKNGYTTFLGIGLAIIAVCYYLWSSPLFMVIGGVIALYSFICLMHSLVTKSDSLAENTGCLIAFIIVVIFVIAFFMNLKKKYYISEYGDQRHLYSNCQKTHGANDYEICKFSAIIGGCYDDCKVCTSRHEAEVERMYIK